MVDDLRDIEIDPDTRDIYLDATNDFTTTTPEETVLQSAYIHARNVTSDYIGTPITGSDMRELQNRIVDALESDDPQLSTVTDVSVGYNESDQKVEVRIDTEFDDSYTIQEEL